MIDQAFKIIPPALSKCLSWFHVILTGLYADIAQSIDGWANDATIPSLAKLTCKTSFDGQETWFPRSSIRIRTVGLNDVADPRRTPARGMGGVSTTRTPPGKKYRS